MIRQLSVFLENRAGQLADITAVLAGEDVDIRALNIAETSDYGLLRMVVADLEKAKKTLEKSGYLATVSEVVSIAVPDQPGGLARALRVLEENKVDVQYMYSIFSRLAGKAYMIMKVSSPEEAERILAEGGVHTATEEELEVC